jgi:hypothetical protein
MGTVLFCHAPVIVWVVTENRLYSCGNVISGPCDFAQGDGEVGTCDFSLGHRRGPHHGAPVRSPPWDTGQSPPWDTGAIPTMGHRGDPHLSR